MSAKIDKILPWVCGIVGSFFGALFGAEYGPKIYRYLGEKFTSKEFLDSAFDSATKKLLK